MKNIVKLEGDISILYQKFQKETNFFDVPLPSRSLGIKEISRLGHNFLIATIDNIDAKCVLLHHRDKKIAFFYFVTLFGEYLRFQLCNSCTD